MNAQIRITTTICTSDANTVWISCAGYREHITFKGKDKAKRARAWADRVGSVRTLADHLRNVAAADCECGATNGRLSPSFFGILGEEHIRLEAIARANLGAANLAQFETLERIAAHEVW